jgi:hypothetical protein
LNPPKKKSTPPLHSSISISHPPKHKGRSPFEQATTHSGQETTIIFGSIVVFDPNRLKHYSTYTMDDSKPPALHQPPPVLMAAALKPDDVIGVDHPPPPLGAGPEPVLLNVGAQLGDVDPDDGDDEMKKAFSRRFFPRYGCLLWRFVLMI